MITPCGLPCPTAGASHSATRSVFSVLCLKQGPPGPPHNLCTRSRRTSPGPRQHTVRQGYASNKLQPYPPTLPYPPTPGQVGRCRAQGAGLCCRRPAAAGTLRGLRAARFHLQLVKLRVEEDVERSLRCAAPARDPAPGRGMGKTLHDQSTRRLDSTRIRLQLPQTRNIR